VTFIGQAVEPPDAPPKSDLINKNTMPGKCPAAGLIASDGQGGARAFSTDERRRAMKRDYIAGFIPPILGAVALCAAASAAMAAPADRQATPLQLAQTTAVIYSPAAPPPPRQETVPPPPAYETQLAYWQPGHWTWDGNNYLWMPGEYVQRPQPQATWIPGQWLPQANGGYMWVEGHWQ
jgi:hypothetical protein